MAGAGERASALLDEGRALFAKKDGPALCKRLALLQIELDAQSAALAPLRGGAP
jgi:hypothetical protein